MRQIAFASLILALIFPGHIDGQQDPTLADVLKQNSVSFGPISVSHLKDRITSYTTLNADHEFLIAYYLDNPGNEMHFPLFLTRFDKLSGKWQEASLTGLQVKISEETEPEIWDDCIGSAVSLEGSGDWYYLNLHWNPSAGCLVVLNRDLTVRRTLTGWTSAFFKSGLLIYEGNMMHFASVHPVTLFLYDPVTNSFQEIYPQKKDPFRKNFSERLEEVIDEKRCQQNNWACDPDDFESGIGPIEVNDETRALAFRVQFGTEGFLIREEAEDSGKWDDDEYVYIYQLDPLRWREFSVYDLKSKFGTDSLKGLLAPEKLGQVFATPAPR